MHLCLAPRSIAFLFCVVLITAPKAFSQESAQKKSIEQEFEESLSDDISTVEPEEEIPITEAEPQAASPESAQVSPNNASSYQSQNEELTYPPDVEVEKSPFEAELTKKDCDCEYNYMMPYKKRRGTFGFTMALGYSQYTPTYYKPDFVVNETYETYYGYTETPMLEMTMGIKWNNALGSIAFDFGAGYYFNNSRNEDDNANLRIVPVRAGGTLALDTLMDEPYVVPYATVGAYTAFYNENVFSQSVQGNTPIGLYWAAGALFQLNWLDESSAIASYSDTGLENTYVYAEARSFMSSTDIPNLGTDPEFGAGLKLEY